MDADLVLAAELGHDTVPGVEQEEPAAGAGPGLESLTDTGAVQGPGDFVIEVDGAGQRVGLGVAFQQGDGNAEIGEQEGRGAADRAGADDDDAIPAAGAMALGCWSFMVVVPFRRSGRLRGTVKAARGW